MNRIYVKLAGGLGNQLFQIAAGYSYSKKNNAILTLDESEWSGSQGNHPSTYKDTIYKNFEFGGSPNSSFVYSEKRFNHDEIPFIEGDLTIRGYFQSLKYFQGYEKDIKELFSFPPVSIDESKLKGSVAMHVRRGDYMKHSHIHYVCNTEYFKNTFFDNFCYRSDLIYKAHIYTDSTDLVAKEFENADFDYSIIETKNEIEGIYMLGLYDNIICSNSSFSWWGSFLGKEKSSIFVPDIWFNNFQNHDDIYRSDFIRIKI